VRSPLPASSPLTFLATGLLAVTTAALCMAAPATAASPVGDHATRTTSGPTVVLQPSADARAAGIRAPGQAYMGWHTGPATSAPADEAAPRSIGTLATVEGMDVASHQGNVDWASWWGQGKRFAYVKATEGTYYTNPYFAQQYNGSYNVGMIRGAYHFARPDTTSGATQANYFVDHGGGWSADGKTLPGALDIEYNPYGATCYGLSHSAMVGWIRSFSDQYRARTGRDPVIYSTTDWWTQCTGNNGSFGSTNPLWIARYASSPGTLPAGWSFHTFWQYTSSPLDQNRFNGAYDRLQALANG
jgi:GH25 family lysozyme M1 (1,4-beta-N-acetylmuramidase)